jgi:hypothetical protein
MSGENVKTGSEKTVACFVIQQLGKILDKRSKTYTRSLLKKKRLFRCIYTNLLNNFNIITR